MRAFRLSKELCYEFLRKQATIANLKDGKYLRSTQQNTEDKKKKKKRIWLDIAVNLLVNHHTIKDVTLQ